MMSRLAIHLFIHLLLIRALKAQQIIFPTNPTPCPPDSCRNLGNSRDSIIELDKQRACRCDNLCAEHGDCCYDAQTYDPHLAIQARLTWKCTNLRNYFGIFLKVACPTTWRDDDIRTACESQPTERDPITKLPVTSRLTQLTYKNIYCASCNSDTKSLIQWIAHLECSDVPLNFSGIDFWSKIYYNSSVNLWGFSLPNSTFTSCSVDAQLPQTVEDLVRRCTPFINDCALNWTDETIRKKCHSYTSYKYAGNFAYRNEECAKCNNVNPPLNCLKLDSRFAVHKFQTGVFTMLFDVNQNTGDIVAANKKCDETEIYDPFIRQCRSVLCSKPKHTFNNGRCTPDFDYVPDAPTMTTPFDTDVIVFPIDENFYSEEEEEEDEEKTSLHDTQSTTLVYEGRHFNHSDVIVSFPGDVIQNYTSLDCQKFTYNQSDISIFGNGSIYLKTYNKMIAPEDYQRENNKIYICVETVLGTDFSNYSRKFSITLSIVSIIGLILSIICIIVHLICTCLVSDLRNLSGKNLASLCIALLLAYSMFIISQFTSISPSICTAVGVSMYFGFLASFFWMNTMAYDVWRALRQATAELRVTSGRQYRRFIVYSFYSWLSPLLIVAISVGIENMESIPEEYKPGFGLVLCWFSHRRALLMFFVVPVVAVILTNVALFSLSARMILSTMKSAPKLHTVSSRRNFRLYLRLALLMGLTWLTGIVAAMMDVEVLWYVFVVFNTLQGLFIFFAFTCTKKVLRALSPLFGRKRVRGKFNLANLNSNSRSANKSGLEPKDSQSSHTSRTSLTQINSSE